MNRFKLWGTRFHGAPTLFSILRKNGFELETKMPGHFARAFS
jgi:hypothetical protein